jgi:septation ring formation regulator EzrA
MDEADLEGVRRMAAQLQTQLESMREKYHMTQEEFDELKNTYELDGLLFDMQAKHIEELLGDGDPGKRFEGVLELMNDDLKRFNFLFEKIVDLKQEIEALKATAKGGGNAAA